MQINEKNYEITTSQYDYGVPVVFEAGEAQGFQIGDKIVFVFQNDVIEDRIYTVSTSDYSFNFALEKAEADNLLATAVKNPVSVRYSVKRYVDDQFLETLVDSKLIVKNTLKWDGE